jgi:hypothetical protein
MSSEESASSEPPQALSYRRIDPSHAQWLFVGSFTSIGEWHAAKALLERNGIQARMAENPYDADASNLLVLAPDVLWAAELIRKANEPKMEQPSSKPMPNYGWALAILWTMLGIIVVILVLMLAAYQSS